MGKNRKEAPAERTPRSAEQDKNSPVLLQENVQVFFIGDFNHRFSL
jgi:hypothetical protein